MAEKNAAIYNDVKLILENARSTAIRSVNFSMVVAYWKIGERIADEELKGKRRAQYGEKLIQELSKKLTKDFGKGFTSSNIRYMRLFYLSFPIHHAVRDGLKKPAIKKKDNIIMPANCSEKNQTIAKYSVLNESKTIFASKYKLYLPTEKELIKELKVELEWFHKKKMK